MTNDHIAKALLAGASEYHDTLIDLARGVDRFRQIMDFIVRCIEFAENYIPEDRNSGWLVENPHIPLMNTRATVLFSFESNDPSTAMDYLLSGSTSGSSDAFLFLMNNYNYYESKESRGEVLDLSVHYRNLFGRPEDINFVYTGINSFAPDAGDKFQHSFDSLASLPEDEDAQGPLLEMRSAIDMSLNALLNLTPLSKAERGDLKSVQVIPAIANHLAKDDYSLVDLLTANELFEDLKNKLAASKQKKIPRDQADALMTQSVSLLSQIIKSINLPDAGVE
jgi:hypothetical protein